MKPDFRLENHPLMLMRPSIVPPYGWVGHIPFAYLVVDLLRPRRLVELGTHSGNSYMAFCQAVDALDLDCRCTAVDSWEGDSHARLYGEDVYESLRARHDPAFGTFSNLFRSSFDAALENFEDGSIDLLHIDGLHTYDAVCHDFEAWLPKLSDRAVVLLHDIHVNERDFGVSRFLDELSQRYACFSFHHSHGLGVVAVGTNLPPGFAAFMRHAGESGEAIRRYFEALAATLVDASGHPAEGAVVNGQPIVCQLFYRGCNEGFDEERMLSCKVDPAHGTLDLRFRLPAGTRPDYLRLDPADLPGIYGLQQVTLGWNGQEAQALSGLPDRIGHVSGELLPTLGPPSLRLISFDHDPYVEFEIGSALEAADVAEGLEVLVRVVYELVLTDRASLRMIEQNALFLTDMGERAVQRADVSRIQRELALQRTEAARLSADVARHRALLDAELKAQRESLRHLVEQSGHIGATQAVLTGEMVRLGQGIQLLMRRRVWSRIRRLFGRA